MSVGPKIVTDEGRGISLTIPFKLPSSITVFNVAGEERKGNETDDVETHRTTWDDNCVTTKANKESSSILFRRNERREARKYAKLNPNASTKIWEM